MGFFDLGIRNYQTRQAMQTGHVELSFWQKLVGVFSPSSIEQVRSLQRVLPHCQSYQERANVCANAVRNPDIRNGLKLKLIGDNQIDLHFDFNGESIILQADFITPANDDNHGFTFEKKKHLIQTNGNNELPYVASMPSLSRHDLSQVVFDSAEGSKLNLDTVTQIPEHQAQNWELSQNRTINVEKNAGIISLAIYGPGNQSDPIEAITLIENEPGHFIVQRQERVGALIPDYGLFENLTFSYQDVQRFLNEQHEQIMHYANQQPPNGQLELKGRLGAAEHKVIITKKAADDTLTVSVLPPKYLSKTAAYVDEKRFQQLKNANWIKCIESERPNDAQDLLDLLTKVPEHKERIFHIPQGKNREYRYGGIEFKYDLDTKQLSDIEELSRKKSKRPDEAENLGDDRLRQMQFAGRPYFVGRHLRGMTLERHFGADSQPLPHDIKLKLIELSRETLKQGQLFWDLSRQNVLIDKHGNLSLCDGVMPLNVAQTFDFNMFIFRINQQLGDNYLTELPDNMQPELAGDHILNRLRTVMEHI